MVTWGEGVWKLPFLQWRPFWMTPYKTLIFYQDFYFTDTEDSRDIKGRKRTMFIPLYLFHPVTNIQTFTCNFACEMTNTYPTNASRVFHFETTWKRSFQRRFNVEYSWCVCRVFLVKSHVTRLLLNEIFIWICNWLIISWTLTSV